MAIVINKRTKIENVSDCPFDHKPPSKRFTKINEMDNISDFTLVSIIGKIHIRSEQCEVKVQENFRQTCTRLTASGQKFSSSVHSFNCICAKISFIRASVWLHPCENFLHPCIRVTASVQKFSSSVHPCGSSVSNCFAIRFSYVRLPCVRLPCVHS